MKESKEQIAEHRIQSLARSRASVSLHLNRQRLAQSSRTGRGALT
jgi:hypothetical protein